MGRFRIKMENQPSGFESRLRSAFLLAAKAQGGRQMEDRVHQGRLATQVKSNWALHLSAKGYAALPHVIRLCLYGVELRCRALLQLGLASPGLRLVLRAQHTKSAGRRFRALLRFRAWRLFMLLHLVPTTPRRWTRGSRGGGRCRRAFPRRRPLAGASTLACGPLGAPP